MFYGNVQSGERPSQVLLERLPDGSANVRLADNIVEMTVEEQTVFQYDEVTFNLPADREETIKSIKKNFTDWWDFGIQPEEPPATLEQRVSDLEDVILALLSE